MQIVKAQAGISLQGRTPGQSINDLDTDLEVVGALGPEPQFSLREIMRAVGDNMHVQFREVAEDAEKQMGDWSMSLDPHTGKLNGNIVVRLGTVQEVAQIEKEIHGTTLNIGKETAAISVHNKVVDRLPLSLQGNA